MCNNFQKFNLKKYIMYRYNFRFEITLYKKCSSKRTAFLLN